MGEFALVEFIALVGTDYITLIEKLKSLNINFKIVDSVSTSHGQVFCGLETEYATMIKLTDAFLAERMRISYIPETLKNKYRNEGVS